MSNNERHVNTPPQADWTSRELTANNIDIRDTDEAEFFGAPLAVLEAGNDSLEKRGIHKPGEDVPESESDTTVALLQRLDSTVRSIGGEDVVMDSLAADLLLALGCETDDTVVRTRERLWLTMCGQQVALTVDVCLVDANSEILLLVQGSALTRSATSDPEAHVVACAIAAFQLNSRKRERESSEEALYIWCVPAIVMIGAFPVFYKIKVTKDLDLGVRIGRYPIRTTVVQRYTPDVPSRDIVQGEGGMKLLEDGKIVLRWYRAFRRFVLQPSACAIQPGVLAK
ncbi:hypothetical protein BU17DRAFT_56419 [Hysterangium stoloniferum]|nr:hypothetical protein BU17DRAFT_56419 [Hysterangium stoloniferum]